MCNFKGRDKQALLRHYSGKHGILDNYLKEALEGKLNAYVPREQGIKRTHSNVNITDDRSKSFHIETSYIFH